MVTPQSPTPDTYHVAMKAFVRKGRDVLICRERVSGRWDLPGGRIGVGEFDMPLGDILKREIAEELGLEFRYKNNGPVAVFRHRRPEISAEGKPEVRVLMIGFELEYLGGKITLSDEHSDYRWIPTEEAAALLPGGQRDGMQKYREYLRRERRGLVY